MPFRMNLPGGAEPVTHVFQHGGTPALVAKRWEMFTLMYDAPETTISMREREAMRFPLTVMIECPICNGLRLWRDWPGYKGEPIPEEFYQNAEAQNLDWPGFSAREKLLIEFVNRFSDDIENLNGDDPYWDRLNAHFTESEIGDIVIMAGAWLGFGRGLKALGVGSVCALPDKPAAAALDAVRAPHV